MSCGDVIFKGDEAGIVTACARDAGRLFAVVDMLILQAHVTSHASRFVCSEDVQVWRIESIEQCVAWKFSADNSVTVIRT